MAIYPDISHHHPVTDWDAVKKNCAFLISKATEGVTYIDPTLDIFIRKCEDLKIPYWLYTYLRAGNEVEQVKFMVKTCKPRVGSMFRGYCLDVEAGNKAANVAAALTYLNGLGGKTMLYTMFAQHKTYASVINARGVNCAWWEARYGANNGQYTGDKYPAHSGVDLHQYTSTGAVKGIKGNVDLNRITGTKPLSWFTDVKTAPVVKEEKKMITVELTTLCKDVSAPEVKTLQRLLNSMDYACGVVDGCFGKKTDAALRAFQKDMKLYVDGVCGQKTWSKLLNV